jgi:hypothetical protein
MTDEEMPHHHTLADLPAERRREIARLGGLTSKGGFRSMTPEQLREAAAKGGRLRAQRRRQAKEEAS